MNIKVFASNVVRLLLASNNGNSANNDYERMKTTAPFLDKHVLINRIYLYKELCYPELMIKHDNITV